MVAGVFQPSVKFGFLIVNTLDWNEIHLTETKYAKHLRKISID